MLTPVEEIEGETVRLYSLQPEGHQELVPLQDDRTRARLPSTAYALANFCFWHADGVRTKHTITEYRDRPDWEPNSANVWFLALPPSPPTPAHTRRLSLPCLKGHRTDGLRSSVVAFSAVQTEARRCKSWHLIHAGRSSCLVTCRCGEGDCHAAYWGLNSYRCLATWRMSVAQQDRQQSVLRKLQDPESPPTAPLPPQ